MFVQVFTGSVTDVDRLRRLMQRWDDELRPGAVGHLGTTAGVTDGGEFVALARFADAASAARNSARAEQSAWWAEVEACFTRPPVFRESDDVTVYLGGGSDDAGFVQVMTGRCVDRARAETLEREWVPRLAPLRPDLLGGYTAWHADGTFTEVAYFTSETDARAGEAMEIPEEVQGALTESDDCYRDVVYLDITGPWFT